MEAEDARSASDPRRQEGPGPVAVAFGGQIRSVQQGRGLTLRAFAERLGISHGFLSDVEAGKAKPSPKLVARIDELGRLNGALVQAYPELLAEFEARRQARVERRQQLAKQAEVRTGGSRSRASSSAGMGTNLQKPSYSEARSAAVARDGEATTREDEANRREAIKTLGALVAAGATRARHFLRYVEHPNVGPLTLDEYDEKALWLSEHATIAPMPKLLPVAATQFNAVANLLEEGRHSSAQRAHLELLAGQFAYYQGRFSFNLGDHQAARAHQRIARHYGEQLDHHLLLASTGLIESAIAFYQGRFDRSLGIVREARPYATEYTVARLFANEARILGSLGPRFTAEMREALDHAEASLPGQLSLEPGAESPFGPETFAFYASTACVRAGDSRAEEFSREAIRQYETLEAGKDERFEFENLALARLNLAMSLLQAKRPEPREAARVGIQALAVPRQLQTDPVKRRVNELLMAFSLVASWRILPAVKELGEVARGYRPMVLPAPGPRPALGSS
jgi:transcriptional regulator with XRE-family HTH domain